MTAPSGSTAADRALWEGWWLAVRQLVSLGEVSPRAAYIVLGTLRGTFARATLHPEDQDGHRELEAALEAVMLSDPLFVRALGSGLLKVAPDDLADLLGDGFEAGP